MIIIDPSRRVIKSVINVLITHGIEESGVLFRRDFVSLGNSPISIAVIASVIQIAEAGTLIKGGLLLIILLHASFKKLKLSN